MGRISDWLKKNSSDEKIQGTYGIELVKDCQLFMKMKEYRTEVMGASFRNINQIIDLAGIEYLTISPQLLSQLSNTNQSEPLKTNLTKEFYEEPIVAVSADQFYSILQKDKLAQELLTDGIERFSTDAISLEKYIQETLIK